jgi:hypothetical protein
MGGDGKVQSLGKSMTDAKSIAIAVFLLPSLATTAPAAQRTMISDFTGLDCAVNSDGGSLRAEPNVEAAEILSLSDGTEAHIYGGKQFGKFVAIPNSDEEFARTWFRVKAKGVSGWIQSGSINCGG